MADLLDSSEDQATTRSSGSSRPRSGNGSSPRGPGGSRGPGGRSDSSRPRGLQSAGRSRGKVSGGGLDRPAPSSQPTPAAASDAPTETAPPKTSPTPAATAPTVKPATDSSAGTGSVSPSSPASLTPGGFFKKNRKKLGLGGMLIAGIVAVTVFTISLAPFKLIHLRELMSQYFGARQDHTSSLRIGKIWQAVADKDGNLTYERNTGHPLRDQLYNVDTKKLVNDMREKGLNLGLDSKTGRITLDGQQIDGDLSDRRSVVRTQLSQAYPEDGYWRRALRSKRAFAAYGISFRFFEDTKEKVNDWEREVKQKIRERLFGDATDTNLAASSDAKKGDPGEEVSGETAKAINDLNADLGAAADDQRQKALADPDFKIPDPRTDLSAAELAKDGASDSVKGALNITAWITQACNIKNLMTEVKIAARIYRARALARYAGVFLVAADTLKSGDPVPPQEVDALSQTTDDMENSDMFQRIEGVQPNRTVSTAPKYSLDLTAQGGGAGFFVTLSNALDAIPGGGLTCKIATNILFQIGSTIGTLVADFFSGGGISILGVAISAASSFAIGAVEEVLKPMAINMLAGMTVTGDEPGKDRGDALAGGSDVIFNDIARRNGGQALSGAQLTTLNDTIAREQAQTNAHLGLADQVFNLNNPGSVSARFAFAVPSSFSGFASIFSQYVASINPFTFEKSLVAPGGILGHLAGTASAAYPPANDPLGVTQEGLPDAVINSKDVADPIANEAYILDNPANKQQWDDFRTKCFNSDFVDDADETMCNDTTNPLYNRFRVYQTDLGLAGGIDFTTGSADLLPDVDSE